MHRCKQCCRAMLGKREGEKYVMFCDNECLMNYLENFGDEQFEKGRDAEYLNERGYTR